MRYPQASYGTFVKLRLNADVFEKELTESADTVHF